MVIAGGVDGERAEEFSGGGVDDADVEVVCCARDRKNATLLSDAIGSAAQPL